MPAVPHGLSVEEWNDDLAREHDIDAYYKRANPIVRAIERMRLRRIRSLLAPKPGERILEVGCGGGHVLERFAECDLVGVDVSGEMLQKARRRLRGLRVELHKGELGDVELAQLSFDAVICTEAARLSFSRGSRRSGAASSSDPARRRLDGVQRRARCALHPADAVPWRSASRGLAAAAAPRD